MFRQKRLTVLAKYGLEAELAQTGGEVPGSRREEVILATDGNGGTDCNEEEPQGVAISRMTTLLRGKQGEASNTFSEDDTESGVDESSHWRAVLTSGDGQQETWV